jgi:hypothetical protein
VPGRAPVAGDDVVRVAAEEEHGQRVGRHVWWTRRGGGVLAGQQIEAAGRCSVPAGYGILFLFGVQGRLRLRPL